MLSGSMICSHQLVAWVTTICFKNGWPPPKWINWEAQRAARSPLSLSQWTGMPLHRAFLPPAPDIPMGLGGISRKSSAFPLISAGWKKRKGKDRKRHSTEQKQKQLCTTSLIYSCDVNIFPISRVERHSVDIKLWVTQGCLPSSQALQ